jgi:tRNA(fMet)-specific endonuclease VapC
MTRYLLDTGIASDYINRRKQVFERATRLASAGAKIGVCTPIVGELFSGVELSATRERNRTKLIHNLDSLTIWPFDLDAAEEFGRLFAVLRRAGRPMQQIDIQIAAVAFALGSCTVVTKDGDFSAIPGLNVENWTTN